MASGNPPRFQKFFWGGGQDGAAYYAQNIAMRTWPSLESCKPVLAAAIDDIPFDAKDGRPFVIADYGCQDGGVSVPLIRHLVDHTRQKHKPEPDIHIMYEDLPNADFKSLFLMTNALTGAAYDSAWSHQRGVYFSATGRSFYEQCFPRETVHVGLCTHAIMYLSTRPCPLPDVLVYSLADEKKQALFAKQAALDWETFLLPRCRELVPGGRLFLIAFFTTKDGQHLGFTEGGRNKFETLRTIWNQLYEEGKITKEELEEPTFNYYLNTVEEFRAPFLNRRSAVYKEGLRLISIETKIVPCVYQEALQKYGTEDPDVLADLVHEFVMSLRSWGNGDFLAALSSRPEPERREIVDELFHRLEALIRTEPTLHKNDQPLAYIMIQKHS